MKLQNLLICIMLLAMVACTSKETTTEEAEDATTTETETEDKSKRPSPPASTTADINGVNVTLDYSSPSVKGREIWGDLVAYDKVWRTGANEANVFTTDGNVLINGMELPQGQYSLFTIPSENNWVVIFNKVAEQWGAYDYDPAEDALRVEVTPEETTEMQETLKFDISNGGTLTFHWENKSFTLNIEPANAG